MALGLGAQWEPNGPNLRGAYRGRRAGNRASALNEVDNRATRTRAGGGLRLDSGCRRRGRQTGRWVCLYNIYNMYIGLCS